MVPKSTMNHRPKTVLVALNAKYAHSSLALRYLQKSNPAHHIALAEFTINDDLHHIYSTLHALDAAVYCFSCYIWNVELTLKVAHMLKLALPHCRIVLGGPECSYNAPQVLEQHPFVDHILLGEGEIILGQLLDVLAQGQTPPPTLTQTTPLDLSLLPQPYTEQDLAQLRGKLIYFETSRGCPFRCSYCLSAEENGVRYFPMDYVKRGLDLMFAQDVPLIKLIDRTFNANSKRAEEIIRYIMDHSHGTCVHLEIEPLLLTPALIDLLATAPPGLFQLEMGIQSTHGPTLESVQRSSNFQQAAQNIRQLTKADNMHIHLDLIAGMPYDTMDSFRRSFGDVYALRPHMLQLGFLKVLHGAPIAQDSRIVHTPFPPYEVLATPWMTSGELCQLKTVESAVDLFYNSGAFRRTMELLSATYDPFALYTMLAPLTLQKHRRSALYQQVYDLFGADVAAPLTYDFLQHNRGHALPTFARRWQPRNFKKRCYELLAQDTFLTAFDIAADLKTIRFDPVLETVLLTDDNRGRVYDVGGYFTPDEPLQGPSA